MSTIQSNTKAYFTKTISSLASDHYCYSSPSVHHKTKTTPSYFTKTITNYQKSIWTSFKHHIKDLIFYRPHSTNVHEANKHFVEAILDADRLFIFTENENSTNCTHLPRHICKLLQQRNHSCKRNRSPQIITLTIT